MIIVINCYIQLHLNLLTEGRFTLKCYRIGYYSVMVKYHDKSKLQKKAYTQVHGKLTPEDFSYLIISTSRLLIPPIALITSHYYSNQCISSFPFTTELGENIL